ncbi:MAG: hypothetical protein HS115_11915 [Spirochaetales bacterium]|nr:hypothetical protein [Spirochaetales bacterium]
MRRTVSVLILLWLFGCRPPAAPIATFETLFLPEHYAGKANDPELGKRHYQEFLELKDRNPKAAKDKLIAAIRHLPEGSYYYALGSLLWLDSPDFAQKALRIAFDKGGAEAHLAAYNLACLYSLEEKYEESEFFLQKAIEQGYLNYRHVHSDPDLAALRRVSKLFKVSGIRYSQAGGGDQINRYFCPDGKYVEHRAEGISCVKNVIKISSYVQEDGSFYILNGEERKRFEPLEVLSSPITINTIHSIKSECERYDRPEIFMAGPDCP